MAEPMSRRGGRKQRQRAREVAQEPQTVVGSAHIQSRLTSKLATWAIHQWAWGSVSAAKVQQVCHAAVQDMRELSAKFGAPSDVHIPPELLKLTSFGAGGKAFWQDSARVD